MDTVVLILVFSTFLLAGMIKGVIGLGLPTVSLAILTVVIGLPQAMALLLVPSLLTNVWQAFKRNLGFEIGRMVLSFRHVESSSS